MTRNHGKKGNSRDGRRSAGPWKAISMAGCICITMAMFSGCVKSRIRPTGLEPQSKVITGLQYRVIGEAEGQSSSFNLLWVFPVTPRVSYESAVNDAIARLGGDNLIDVRTWVERQIWLVGMVEIVWVRGKVISYGDDRAGHEEGK